MTEDRYIGKMQDLDEVGNTSGKVPERKIIPIKAYAAAPRMILKEYHLQNEGEDLPTLGESVMLWYDLNEEIKEGRLNPLSGLGFLIVSKDISNLCRWDTTYPDVIVPQIYTRKNNTWSRQPIEEVGAFCSGEKRVYDHENTAWLRYLNSPKTRHDKLVYLNDFLLE